MTDETTARLILPLLAPGQAQKEMTHNEALAALDLAVQASVLTAPADDPPGTPAIGDCWIVGAAPSGAWIDHAGAIAGWTAGGWRFLAPREGLTAWVVDSGCVARHHDGEWTLATPADAIDAPSGGGTVDTQARSVITLILSALRHHRLILAD